MLGEIFISVLQKKLLLQRAFFHLVSFIKVFLN